MLARLARWIVLGKKWPPGCALWAAVWLVMALVSGRAGGEELAAWLDTREARPFHCRATFDLDDHERLFQDLSELQHDLGRTLGIRFSGEVVELYLFDSKSNYRRYLEAHYPQVPFRRALYIKHRGPGMVYAYQTRELPVDVRHEATHALLHTALADVPLWLDEGLAEYFEVAPSERAYDHPHLSAVRWSLWSTVQPLETLEAKQDLNEMGRREYREAWAWVHFMLHGPLAARREFATYLADLQAGRPAGSLSERLRWRLGDPHPRLVEHFEQWKRPAE